LSLSIVHIILHPPSRVPSGICHRLFECVATYVGDTFVLGKLFDIIAVKHTPSIPNLMPGDKFTCRLDDIQYHEDMCQLQTVPPKERGKRVQTDGDEHAPAKRRVVRTE